MKLNPGARTQAIVLLLLVATAGALAGVVGDRMLTDRGGSSRAWDAPRAGPAPGGPWRWEARPDERYGERLGVSLELSAAQRAAIDSIVAQQQARVQALTDEIQPRFRAIAEEARGSIEDVLTPEQRERLRGLREERLRGMRPGMREMMRDRQREGPPAGMHNGMPPGAPGGRMRERLDSVRG
jgi:Spy/CpxP family protein refolding chaperone